MVRGRGTPRADLVAELYRGERVFGDAVEVLLATADNVAHRDDDTGRTSGSIRRKLSSRAVNLYVIISSFIYSYVSL